MKTPNENMNNEEIWQMGGVKSYEVIDQTKAASDLSAASGSAEQTLRRVDAYLKRRELEYLVHENKNLDSLPQWMKDLRKIISQNK